MIAGFGHVEDRDGLRGLPAGDQQCTDAAFERRDPIFDGRLGRVHDPGVDVAQFLQGKEVRGVRRVVERGTTSSDRSAAPGRGLFRRGLAGVDLLGFKRTRRRS